MVRKCIVVGVILLLMPTMVRLSDASEVDKLLAIPEKKVDIGIAALSFAKEFYPTLDVDAYSKKIDVLAARVKAFTNGSMDPEERIRALNTVIYKIEGFSYDRSKSPEAKLDNHFLNGILDTKKGTCVNMPILYLAIAQRLGYPVYPVAAPDHLFLRYADPKLKKQNIEATGGGGYSPNEAYIKEFNISKKAVKHGAYLRTMTYREFLADLLGENAIHYARKGNSDKAIAYLERAIKINPKFPDYYEELRVLYLRKSKQVQGDDEERCREKAKAYFIKAEELGIATR